MRRALAAALLVVVAVTTSAAQGTNRDIWLAAVARHEPGTWDTAAIAVGTWSAGELDTIFNSLPLARSRPADMNGILIRGAMLHADIAMLAPDGHARRLDPRAARPPRQVLLDDDGRHVGTRMETPDWAFARRLLDALVPEPGGHDVVRLWYRATLAWMAWEGQLAAASSHLPRAAALFPADPDVLFARGWLNEAFAAPRTQAVVASLRDNPRVAGRATIREIVAVPPLAQALERAEEAYTAALEADPRFTEARIHRARIVLLRGRTGDAVPDLRRALDEAQEPMLTYLAALFLGGALETSGDRPGARDAYRRATGLLPRAQSPHLGLSRVASREGDRAAALKHVQTLMTIPSDDPLRGDPWWIYQEGPGRHAERRLAELREAVRRLPWQ